MVTFFLGYLILTLIIVLGLLLYVNAARKRRGTRTDLVPPGYEPTAEITVDPTTGRKQRVWFNSRTGQRFYESLADEERRP